MAGDQRGLQVVWGQAQSQSPICGNLALKQLTSGWFKLFSEGIYIVFSG